MDCFLTQGMRTTLILSTLGEFCPLALTRRDCVTVRVNDLQLARVLLARVAHVIDTRAHVAQTHVAFSLNAICEGNSSGDHFKSVRNAALCIMKTCLLLPRFLKCRIQLGKQNGALKIAFNYG